MSQGTEFFVALQSDGGRCYSYKACGRAIRYGGFDVAVRHNGESRCYAVKPNVRRALQVIAQDFYGRPHFAGGGQCFDEGAQPNFQAEHGALLIGPVGQRCPVQSAVGGLKQPSLRAVAVSAVSLRAEAVKCRQGPRRGDSKDRATVAVAAGCGGWTVEIPVGGLN